MRKRSAEVKRNSLPLCQVVLETNCSTLHREHSRLRVRVHEGFLFIFIFFVLETLSLFTDSNLNLIFFYLFQNKWFTKSRDKVQLDELGTREIN